MYEFLCPNLIRNGFKKISNRRITLHLGNAVQKVFTRLF